MRLRSSRAGWQVHPILLAVALLLSGRPAGAGTALVHVDSSQVLVSASEETVCSSRIFSMMVLLLTLEQEDNPLSLEKRVVVPEKLAGIGHSPLRLKGGEALTLSELVKATLLTSASEAASVMASYLFPSEAEAVASLQRRAHSLALAHTRFTLRRAGKHGQRGPFRSCASLEDAALLAAALLRNDQASRWLELSGMPFRNGKTIVRRTNPIVAKLGKPGPARDRGRGKLVLVTGKAGDLKLVAAAAGTRAGEQASTTVEKCLGQFELARIVEKGQPVGTVEIEGGTVRTLAAVARDSVYLPVRRGAKPEVSVSLQLPAMIRAPVAADQILGELLVKQGSNLWAVVPLRSAFPVPPVAWFHLAKNSRAKRSRGNENWWRNYAKESRFPLR